MTSGRDFSIKDPALDRDVDHDGDYDEQEVNRTRHFQPGMASTPTTGSEQIEMHEQTELPRPETSYAEPSFGGVSTD